MTSDLRNPLKRARNIGSAKSGAGSWMAMQFTSLVLVGLSIWFVVLVLTLMHSDYATARATLAKPWNAVLLAALLITTFRHAVLGLQVVIEDYVHTRWLEVASLVLIKFIAVLAALAGVLAVLRVALGS